MRKRLIAVLLLAAACGLSFAGTLPVTEDPGGGTGGGGYEGDTLAAAEPDTLGPYAVGSCLVLSLFAQWSGDSAQVTVDRSIDQTNWFAVSALASAAHIGTDDSTGIWYAKVYKIAPDTGSVQLFTNSLAPYIRMIVTNNSVGTDSVALITLPITGVKGGVLCVE